MYKKEERKEKKDENREGVEQSYQVGY